MGRCHDEARWTQFAATLCRLAGDLAAAKARCRQALTLCAATGPIAVAAHAELGEIALAEGSAADAAAAFDAAIDAGSADDLGAARAALLRKRAVASTAMARYLDAIADLEAAHDS